MTIRELIARILKAVQHRFARITARTLGTESLDERERHAINQGEDVLETPDQSFIRETYGSENLGSDSETIINNSELLILVALKNLESSVRTKISKLILSEAKRFNQSEFTLQVDPATAAEIVAVLRASSVNWVNEWQLIASTAIFSARQHAQLTALKAEHGDDALVFKTPQPDACDWCAELHLDSAGNPVLFRISDLESNGYDNSGRTKAQWRAVIGATHPWCRCELQLYESTEEKSLDSSMAAVQSPMDDRNVGTGTSGANIKWGVPQPPQSMTDPSMLRDEMEEYASQNDLRPMFILDPRVWNFRDGDVTTPVHPIAEWKDAAEAQVAQLEIEHDTMDWLKRRLKQRSEAGDTHNPMVKKAETYTIEDD